MHQYNYHLHVDENRWDFQRLIDDPKNEKVISQIGNVSKTKILTDSGSGLPKQEPMIVQVNNEKVQRNKIMQLVNYWEEYLEDNNR